MLKVYFIVPKVTHIAQFVIGLKCVIELASNLYFEIFQLRVSHRFIRIYIDRMAMNVQGKFK